MFVAAVVAPTVYCDCVVLWSTGEPSPELRWPIVGSASRLRTPTDNEGEEAESRAEMKDMGGCFFEVQWAVFGVSSAPLERGMGRKGEGEKDRDIHEGLGF